LITITTRSSYSTRKIVKYLMEINALMKILILKINIGEGAARLRLSEYQDAINDAWLDEQRVSNFEKPELMLMDQLKITYMTGKGNNHLVPVLFPSDCLPALEVLAYRSIHRDVSISDSNDYLFACTRRSEKHKSGWLTLHNVVSKIPKIKKPENIKATTNRHRVSTWYASLEIAPHDRELFFQHMRHSGKVNEENYQAPPAKNSGEESFAVRFR